ncbi:hypothetical protein CISG_06494 [Coccidioides immitis RMSCC 3703]|uniref:Uncharacterized protein n=1 Tax=Coccidioides immitis RMSCC 3703 TaxID=454286 RepID=A0A0J8TUJ3_COCIT|nr:hypothetical protein CISG_06494 [Coccidioides immitis RMSCC 3703]
MFPFAPLPKAANSQSITPMLISTVKPPKAPQPGSHRATSLRGKNSPRLQRIPAVQSPFRQLDRAFGVRDTKAMQVAPDGRNSHASHHGFHAWVPDGSEIPLAVEGSDDSIEGLKNTRGNPAREVDYPGLQGSKHEIWYINAGTTGKLFEKADTRGPAKGRRAFASTFYAYAIQ